MKSAKTHIVASTALCALTLAVLLAARGFLPDQVPMQWSLTGRGEGRIAMYYITPAIALIAVVIIVLLGTR